MTDTPSGAPLKVGDKAPAFTLAASSGKKVKLSDYKGKPVVLYFYPKDNTPGCTTEAQQFRDQLDAFAAADAVVLGVSPDSVESHCGFIEKQKLNFTLLSDEEHAVAEKYGVWVEKCAGGKRSMGVQRATFLIGKDGKLDTIWPKVKADGHAAEVLRAVEILKG